MVCEAAIESRWFPDGFWTDRSAGPPGKGRLRRDRARGRRLPRRSSVLGQRAMTFRPSELVPQPTGAAAMPDVRVVAADDVPRDEVEAARQRVARLQRSVSRPLTRLQLTLCRAASDSEH